MPDNGLQQGLERLKQQFLRDLPNRISGLADAMEQLTGEAALPAGATRLKAAEEVRFAAHKLAGTGATFGYPSISETARALELLLTDIRAEELTDAFIADAREAYRSVLLEVPASAMDAWEEPEDGEAVPSEAVTPPPATLPSGAQARRSSRVEHKRTPRLVVLCDDPVAELDPITQLATFGYRVDTVDGLDELEELVGDGERLTVLLVDFDRLTENLEEQNRFRRIRSNLGDNVRMLSIIAFAEADDVGSRLAAIRAGCDGFFGGRPDTVAVVDRIHNISSRVGNEPYHVLLVDDDQEQVSLHAMVLQQAGMITSVTSDPQNIFGLLADGQPDIIMVDMYMPSISGIELTRLIRQRENLIGIPIVFLSVEDDPVRQLTAYDAGADGFLVKPVDDRYLVTMLRLRAQRARELRYVMDRDSLTGLLNHTNLLQAIETEAARADRLETSMCLAMIDLDRFKSVNDTYGHLTGDHVLMSLARLLRDRLRRTDVVGRYGGEEFAVVLAGTSLSEAQELMDGLRDSFGALVHRSPDKTFQLTFSCGITCYRSGESATALVERADEALFAAKDAGRNRVISAEG